MFFSSFFLSQIASYFSLGPHKHFQQRGSKRGRRPHYPYHRSTPCHPSVAFVCPLVASPGLQQLPIAKEALQLGVNCNWLTPSAGELAGEARRCAIPLPLLLCFSLLSYIHLSLSHPTSLSISLIHIVLNATSTKPPSTPVLGLVGVLPHDERR